MLRDAAVVGELFPPAQVASPKKYFAAAFSRAAEEWRLERLLSSALLPFASFLSYGTTAQFGKKSQTGFLSQFKVWKTKESCMYFWFFKLKKWGKKAVETRRRNCAVMPYLKIKMQPHVKPCGLSASAWCPVSEIVLLL